MLRLHRMAPVIRFAIMFVNRLQRYVLLEILRPTIGALVILTFVLLTSRILRVLELVINQGMAFLNALFLFSKLLPALLVVTLPFALLIGTLIGFSRLSADSEVVAMRASGVSYYALLRPVVGIAIITSIVTGWLTLQVEPASRHSFRNALAALSTEHATLALQPGTFNRSIPGLVIYPQSIGSNGRLGTVFIADSRLSKTPTLIFAREGVVGNRGDSPQMTLNLVNGSIHRSGSTDKKNDYQRVDFQQYQLSIDLNQGADKSRTKRTRISDLDLTSLWQGSRQAATPRLQRKHLTELHQRFQLATAPLVFALLATPLGIRSHRSGRSGGFTIGLIVFLLYFMSNSFCETLVIEKEYPVAATLWTPTFLFLICGFLLTRRAARELPYGLPGGFLLKRLFDNLRRRR
ncbi:MAG: LPS export ABC transporter permease LptF [Desulfuromonas sp.]|nr:MAG: LPS export ABC transporter permease LptF [Desulfuromonas sp.]